MTTYRVNITLEEGELVSACAHDHGGISLLGGYSDGSLGWTVVIPYEATAGSAALILLAIAKAKSLRAIHHPEKPPCEPAPTEDATTPEASPS